MPSWVIERQLARSTRPGYVGERGRSVPRPEVDAWLADVKSMGLRSIICLLADDQLKFYEGLPGGLPSYYGEAGFVVEHIPARDHQRPPLAQDHLVRIWKAYQALPKPVLVHCSAGVDRTGLAVNHIRQQLGLIL